MSHDLINSTEPTIKTTGLTRYEWLQARRSGIGGSDIAAIVGASPYATAYDIYQSKTEEPEDEESEFAYWGHILEDTVAREFSKRMDLKVQNVNFLMRHPEHSWAIANIDRAIVNPAIAGNVRFKNGELTTDMILECKTASEYVGKDWGEEETDEVPDQYQCQGQWYMAVTNAQVLYMAVLIGGNKFRIYRIERNQELIDYLFSEAESFWFNHILAGVSPEPGNLENAKDKFRKCNPDTTIDIQADSAEVSILDTYVELKAAEKQLKIDIEEAQKNLICLIGNNETITIDGDIAVTYKNSESNRFDSKRFKIDNPELASAYTKTSLSRTMRIK